MKRLKGLGIIVAIMLLSTSLLNASAAKNSVKAILDLGKQMSNVRNMLETYSLIATKVSYKAPDERLKKGLEEYEAVITFMETSFKDDAIKKSLAKSKEAWKPVKKALLTALEDNDPKRLQEEGLFIHANIRSVIKELANMKKYLFEKEKLKVGKELNAAIEIAASSQRLSAHYMMKMWGLPDPTIQEHWDKGVLIYTDSIALLKASSYYKDAEFKKWLDVTETHLNYFTMVYSFEGKFMPSVVHEKAEDAYEHANKMSAKILSDI